MQINHNVSAVIANNQLRKSENRMTTSVERLSSGLKINRAADDPSGMAISQKMKTQIRGLSRANDNANDGVSVLQTAEGALTEVHSMLQRVRELAVQSANGTYTTEDRKSIQSEVDELLGEINRISNDTQFNNVPLLDGSIDKRGYSNADGVSVVTFSQVVEPATYAINVKSTAAKATVEVTNALKFNGPNGTVDKTEEGAISINGVSVQIKEGETAEEVYLKLRDLAESVSVNLTKEASNADGTMNLKFEAVEYGSNSGVTIQWDNPALEAALSLAGGTITGTSQSTADYFSVVGLDTEVNLLAKDHVSIDPDTDGVTASLNKAIATSDGTKVKITDAGGFEILLDIDAQVKTGALIKLDIMDIGAMTLQIGANEGETMDVKIPAVNTYTLGLDYINLLSQPTSSEAIADIDAAVAMVSSVRSTIGAYQNRLEHAISNLDTSELNMENSLSRIEDVDMAEEMTEYTASSVLQQAGTSVLAQANDLPEMVLQLLG